jgi:hypothetical protein
VCDLHGLDHETAKYLLRALNIPTNNPIKIIFGKASHCARRENVMKKIVDYFVKTHKLIVTTQKDGYYQVKKSELLLSNSVVEAQHS